MSTELATQPTFIKASDRLSSALGIPVSEMIKTLKAQCFRGTNPDNVTDAQLGAFVSIAADMGVNPLLPGMLYAYPDRAGIIPIMGPDGVYKKLSERSDVDSWEVDVFPEDSTLPPTHAIAKIYRKGIERPIKYVAHLNEWRVQTNPNWASRPRHMLTIRALKQAARQIIHGIPGDEDDRAFQVQGEINVTPGAEIVQETPKRLPPPKRSDKGAAAVVENDEKKPETEKKTETAPVEIVAKENPTAPASNVTPPATEPAKNVTPPAAAEERVTGPRFALKDGESGIFLCKVVECAATSKGNMNAKLEGEFQGEVFHLSGATNKDWKNGLVAKFHLNGKQAKNGVYNMVDKIEVLTEDPE